MEIGVAGANETARGLKSHESASTIACPIIEAVLGEFDGRDEATRSPFSGCWVSTQLMIGVWWAIALPPTITLTQLPLKQLVILSELLLNL
jgi:hypothetical protein